MCGFFYSLQTIILLALSTCMRVCDCCVHVFVKPSHEHYPRCDRSSGAVTRQCPGSGPRFLPLAAPHSCSSDGGSACSWRGRDEEATHARQESRVRIGCEAVVPSSVKLDTFTSKHRDFLPETAALRCNSTNLGHQIFRGE